MRRVVLFVLLLASAILLAGNTPAPPVELRGDAPALEVSVTVRPTAHDPYQLLPRGAEGSYRCSAFVSAHDVEADVQRGFKTKDIVILPGEEGEETTTLGSLKLRFEARIARSAAYAETVVTVSREGKLLNRQHSTVWLRSLPAAYRPLG